MKTIYIIHGWSGSPQGDWLDWATKTLRDKGYTVISPAMPDPDQPKINTWVEHLKNTAETLNTDTYFIGHSIGCQTIMRFLETKDTKVGGAIFVAGWFNLTNLEDDESKNIAKPWIETPINTQRVKDNLGYCVTILSDNDPWVPFEDTKNEFTAKLHSEIIELKDAGHVTHDDGFDELPILIEVFEKHLEQGKV